MANEILKHTPLRPKVGIICGTGLGGIGDAVENPVTIPYHEIPGFPLITGKHKLFTYGQRNTKAQLGMDWTHLAQTNKQHHQTGIRLESSRKD